MVPGMEHRAYMIEQAAYKLSYISAPNYIFCKLFM